MNQEIKKQWVDLLRSGNYQQGKNYLKVGQNYCCLGVLCDIIPDRQWVNYENESGDYCKYREELADKCVPTSANSLVQLTRTQSEALVELNDIKGASFIEIAEYIEKNL